MYILYRFIWKTNIGEMEKKTYQNKYKTLHIDIGYSVIYIWEYIFGKKNIYSSKWNEYIIGIPIGII